MPKVMIEIELDIPEGRSIAEAEGAIKRAFDPCWMAEWWHTDDVIEQAESNGEQLYQNEALWVLRMMDKNHDCNVGHTWDSMDHWIDRVIEKREQHETI